MNATDKAHRRDRTAGRVVRRAITVQTAAAAIGPITPGCEIFGLSKGAFSLVDIIEHCLGATGPADVVISTWTAAAADLGFAYALMREDKIRSCKFIVDFSFPVRQPAYAAALRERFGDDSIRVTKSHAKFITIRNAEWNIVIRTSMNLNENKRLESFEISDDAGLASYLAEVVAALFEAQPAGAAFDRRPMDAIREFESLTFGEAGAAGPSVDALKSTDTAKYFSDTPLGVDIRRAGLSFSR
jgi:hypothetical protein